MRFHAIFPLLVAALAAGHAVQRDTADDDPKPKGCRWEAVPWHKPVPTWADDCEARCCWFTCYGKTQPEDCTSHDCVGSRQLLSAGTPARTASMLTSVFYSSQRRARTSATLSASSPLMYVSPYDEGMS